VAFVVKAYDYSSGGGSRADVHDMTQTTITCGGDLADGNRCDQKATVIRTQYVYDRTPVPGGPADYTLREVHFEAICPACGERKLTETY
jgi:hypothetical protein